MPPARPGGVRRRRSTAAPPPPRPGGRIPGPAVPHDGDGERAGGVRAADARGALPGDQEKESAAARKPARPKRRQAAEKAGVERMRRSVARREVVAEEKTFGELGMASANSPPRRRVG